MDDDSLNTVGAHCPTCRQEYRPGFTVCADDGADLVPGPAPAPELPSEHGVARTDVPDLVGDHGPPAVLGAFPLQDALLLAGRLRSVGIRAMAESDGDFGPYRPALVHGVRVLVVPEDLERARRMLERIRSGGDEET